MKKFYAFVAAALMSASLFAGAAVPTAADLAAAYDVNSNVVFCIQFIEDANVCNDIFFIGTPNNWGKGDGSSESWDNCQKFKPVAGFDGWYAAELPYSEGFQGKPLQKPMDGSFTWDYQCGDVDAWVHVDGGDLTIEPGYADECNIKASAAGAYIYQLKYWKKHSNPCVIVPKHKYTVMLYSPTICGDFVPSMAGDFNGWSLTTMNETVDEDFETVYKLVIEDQEGHGFKFRPSDDDESWSKQMQFYNEKEDVWATGGNIELPVATKDTTLVFNYADDNLYRWAACNNEEAVEVWVFLDAPAGAPAAGVEVIGSFDGWSGTMMEYDAEKNYYWTTVEAKASDEFKFREAGDTEWTNQIMQWIPANDENPEGKWDGLPNLKFSEYWEEDLDYPGTYNVFLDLTDPAQYAWTLPQGIENVVLTEQAQKVVVDGVIYIIRNNKMFNLQGAQVR